MTAAAADGAQPLTPASEVAFCLPQVLLQVGAFDNLTIMALSSYMHHFFDETALDLIACATVYPPAVEGVLVAGAPHQGWHHHTVGHRLQPGWVAPPFFGEHLLTMEIPMRTSNSPCLAHIYTATENQCAGQLGSRAID